MHWTLTAQTWGSGRCCLPRCRWRPPRAAGAAVAASRWQAAGWGPQAAAQALPAAAPAPAAATGARWLHEPGLDADDPSAGWSLWGRQTCRLTVSAAGCEVPGWPPRLTPREHPGRCPLRLACQCRCRRQEARARRCCCHPRLTFAGAGAAARGAAALPLRNVGPCTNGCSAGQLTMTQRDALFT